MSKATGCLLLVLGWLIVGVSTCSVVLHSWSNLPQAPGAAIPFLIGCALGMTGYSLAEGRKRTVLFLRPFNVRVANAFTISLIGKHLRKRFRIVALDDGDVAAPTVRPQDRGMFLVIAIPVTLVMTLALVLLQPQAGESNDTLTKVNLIICCGAWGLLTRPLFATMSERALKNRFSINSPADLAAAIRRIRALSGYALRVVTPQVTLFKSSLEPWNDTVISFVQNVDAVVIDVSLASHNVCWELEFLQSRMGCRYVLVAHAHTMGNEKYPGDGSGARLKELIRDIPIQMYSGPFESSREFAEELSRQLAIY